MAHRTYKLVVNFLLFLNFGDNRAWRLFKRSSKASAIKKKKTNRKYKRHFEENEWWGIECKVLKRMT